MGFAFNDASGSKSTKKKQARTLLKIICLFFFKTADDPALLGQFAIFLGVILIQVYIFCLFGEKLSEKSKLVGHKVFQSNLYDCNKEEMKMIQLIIMRSQNPSVVTISKFGIVSLPTFSSVSL